MKSFDDFSAVTKKKGVKECAKCRQRVAANDLDASHQDEDLNFQSTSDVRQWIIRRITNSPTDFYPRVTATNFCLTHHSKLPTFHGLYVFTGRPHKFNILIFVKISARDHNCVKATTRQ